MSAPSTVGALNFASDSMPGTMDAPGEDIARFAVTAGTSLRDTIQLIDTNGAGIALVVDADAAFVDLVTDGDIRRAILKGISLTDPIDTVLREKAAINTRRPVTARIDDPPEFVLMLMERLTLHQIPLLDAKGRVCAVAQRDKLTLRPRITSGNAAVVMAGGFGTRLRPLTETTPKPMLNVGGRPMLEHTVRRLVNSGLERIFITVHYKPEVITEYFGDGSRFGAQISYINEREPLGTAGSIRSADHGDQPMLVMNGDVMTELNFVSLFDFHRRSGALISMAAAPYEVAVPYGVVDVEGVDVTGLEEKPIKRFFINTGIYVLSPDACSRIPPGKAYNMTDLIESATAAGEPVKVYAMHEYWRDIGRLEDLQRVNMELSQNRLAL